MENNKVYCIAEVGINHNGSMKLAKNLIDIAAENDCDAVKFQKRTLTEVYTPEELDKLRESPWGTTNREQKEGLEFSPEEYTELDKYSTDQGLDFIVSCWDMNSIDVVEKSCPNLKYHKVASALLTDKKFLQRLASSGIPVILSTGMSSTEEINAAVEVLGDSCEYILACTSTYPTAPEDINLTHMTTLRFDHPELKVGFSNHYSGMLACVGAVARGSECIEFHITHDRTAYGSDQSASIENVDELMSATRVMEKMLGNGEKVVYSDELGIAEKLRKTNDILL
jgi:N-acetylneuraminate synthase